MEDEKKTEQELDNQDTEESLDDFINGILDSEAEEKNEPSEEERERNREEARKRRAREEEERKRREQKEKEEQSQMIMNEIQELQENHKDLNVEKLLTDDHFLTFINGKTHVNNKHGKTLTELYKDYNTLREHFLKEQEGGRIDPRDEVADNTLGKTAPTHVEDVYSQEELKKLEEKIPYMSPDEFKKVQEKLEKSYNFYDKNFKERN